MTVIELLEHFNIFPDKISFYDERNEIQDTVNIACFSADGEKSYNGKVYDEFINEYGNRYLIDWTYGYDNILDISF